ncbi:hypothetical protein JJQ60_17440 [Aquimarina mytili]|uniref:Uncharacterized protein n=1 Tax=Aquimarina mytili TaxID=874423 RepID=A0A937A1U0_9FLAO|nr:hypothetical protein [Aquimarina mytili]
MAHLVIFIISIFGLTYFYEYIEDESLEMFYSLFHFIIVLILYLMSGYLLTNGIDKFQIKNYCAIAFIGILIWFLAFINSPTDLDWKKGNGGILWLLYRIYISGIETPFNFSDNLSIWSKNSNINLAVLLILSIIPSSLQALGGFLKVWK